MELQTHTFSDKATSTLRFWAAHDKKAPLFIILPAMGTWAKYYEPFAEALYEKGYNVLAADWRGHGTSSVLASRKTNFGYKKLLSDIKLACVKKLQ